MSSGNAKKVSSCFRYYGLYQGVILREFLHQSQSFKLDLFLRICLTNLKREFLKLLHVQMRVFPYSYYSTPQLWSYVVFAGHYH